MGKDFMLSSRRELNQDIVGPDQEDQVPQIIATEDFAIVKQLDTHSSHSQFINRIINTNHSVTHSVKKSSTK